MTVQPNLPSERSSETRSRILEAALREFSAHGLAGARTERIAAAAGVNKALLYYYFASKDKLYQATLGEIAERVRDQTLAVVQRGASAGERVLRVALNHFDRILGQQEFQSLMQQEMMRLHKGEGGGLPILVKRVFEPVMAMYQTTVQEGIASGELIEVDWMHIHLASLGANVFYFLSAPIFKMVTGQDPLAADAIVHRRQVVVEFLGQTIFTDRAHGVELAARVLADTPMPKIATEGFLFGRKA
ncbi:MAG TPA: TetR/AcrR family transcriptional regulator [Terracidiphilus sp.]|nr:TetR/AcrR family transcriptional regulator [Terracidiphilus sp.]